SKARTRRDDLQRARRRMVRWRGRDSSARLGGLLLETLTHRPHLHSRLRWYARLGRRLRFTPDRLARPIDGPTRPNGIRAIRPALVPGRTLLAVTVGRRPPIATDVLTITLASAGPRLQDAEGVVDAGRERLRRPRADVGQQMRFVEREISRGLHRLMRVRR